MERLSWGRAHRYRHDVWAPADLGTLRAAFAAGPGAPVLPYGLGRSYGDSCLNADGILVDLRRFDHFLAFDEATGVLHVEAGVRLATIVDLLARRAAPDGSAWFLPVSPGTAMVTVGGAIANDVHGKNHHWMGSFGCHVRALRLLRSDGSLRRCSPTEEPELFRATVGGLGLTGIVLDAELQLRRVPGLAVANEDIRIGGLAEFYGLAGESADRDEYTVAWIDCLATGSRLGRGIFSRANHLEGPVRLPPAGAAGLALPLPPPVSPLNRFTIGAFNALYWRKSWPRRRVRRRLPVTKILYPLDGIAGWNRLYGRHGFYQYQCVVPAVAAEGAVRELLTTVARAGEGSFLAVLKTLGGRASPGLLSFPMPGTTLALDFPNRGVPTLALLDRLDAITAAAGGRVYPAKDGRMAGAFFRRAYPGLDRFVPQLDPAFSSSFWRRMAVAEAPLRAAA
jgi:FAD/FMN-containing dehydrogenase